ncbi:MAG TPA: hypothetical protein VIL34_03465 [Actinopolymorphaceae bacterium]
MGQEGGNLSIKLAEPLTADAKEAIEAEALTMPIPNTTMRVTITEN